MIEDTVLCKEVRWLFRDFFRIITPPICGQFAASVIHGLDNLSPFLFDTHSNVPN